MPCERGTARGTTLCTTPLGVEALPRAAFQLRRSCQAPAMTWHAHVHSACLCRGEGLDVTTA
eukprot:8312760-Pyramimonas_sp.AAC.1